MLQVNDIEAATVAYLDAVGLTIAATAIRADSGVCDLCAKPYKAKPSGWCLGTKEEYSPQRNRQDRAVTVTVAGRKLRTCYVCRNSLKNAIVKTYTGTATNAHVESTEKRDEVDAERLKLESMYAPNGDYTLVAEKEPLATATWLVARLKRRAEVEEYGLYGQ